MISPLLEATLGVVKSLERREIRVLSVTTDAPRLHAQILIPYEQLEQANDGRHVAYTLVSLEPERRGVTASFEAVPGVSTLRVTVQAVCRISDMPVAERWAMIERKLNEHLSELRLEGVFG